MTHTHIHDEVLGRAADALGTEQEKDTVDAASRAAVAEAEKDEAWAQLWDYVDAGGFSTEAHLDAEREHLAHERATVDEIVRESSSDTRGTSGRGSA